MSGLRGLQSKEMRVLWAKEKRIEGLADFMVQMSELGELYGTNVRVGA